MKSCGMEIGSHGYEHFWLNSLKKTDQILDIKNSLSFIKLINSKDDKFIFCYPYGGYDNNTLEILDKYNCEINEPLWETEESEHIIISDPDGNYLELESKKNN